MDNKIFYIVLGVYLFMSFITFMAYYFDKRKSIKGKYRTKEKTLLTMTVLFGSLGSLLGLYQLRHKNKKWYFVFITFASLIIHIAVLVYLFTLIK